VGQRDLNPAGKWVQLHYFKLDTGYQICSKVYILEMIKLFNIDIN